MRGAGANLNLGSAPFYRTSNDVIQPVSQHVDYLYRPPEMRNFALYEFTGLTYIVKLPSARRTRGGRGQRQRRTRRLDSQAAGDLVDDDVEEDDDEEVEEEAEEVDEAEVESDGEEEQVEAEPVEMDVVTATPEQEQDARDQRGHTGRKENKVFRFREGHPLYNTHGVKLRSKHNTPILAGGAPPKYPGPTPARFTRAKKRQADYFAAYMLTLLCPWEPPVGARGSVPPYPLNWGGFCRYMADMDAKGNRSWLNRNRAALVHNIAMSFMINEQLRVASNTFRARCATRWTEDPDGVLSEGAFLQGHGGPTMADIERELGDEQAAQELMRQIEGLHAATGTEENDIRRLLPVLQYSAETEKVIREVFDFGDDEIADAQAHHRQQQQSRAVLTNLPPSIHVDTPIFQTSANSIVALLKVLKAKRVTGRGNAAAPNAASSATTDQPPSVVGDAEVSQQSGQEDHSQQQQQDQEDQQQQHEELVRQRDARADECKREARLNVKQRAIFTKVHTYFRELEDWRYTNSQPLTAIARAPPPQPPLLFVHGGPGVGKTHLTRSIIKLADIYDLQSAVCTPTGVTAILYEEGYTLHSMFGISVQQAKNNEPLPLVSAPKLAKLRKDMEHATLLVIDEISMVAPNQLAHMNAIAQQIKGSSAVFGGMTVLILGDFFQMAPIQAESIFKAALDRYVDGEAASSSETSNDARQRTQLGHGHAAASTTAAATSTVGQTGSRDGDGDGDGDDGGEHDDEDERRPSRRRRAREQPKLAAKQGVDVFLQFEYHALTEQMRAAEDAEHTAIIEAMRVPGQRPFSREVVNKLGRQVLTREDVQRDPLGWLEATTVVTSNFERHNINLIRARIYAKALGTCVILFPKKCHKSLDENQALRDQVYRYNDVMWEIFVAGAPAYLLENINPSKGLANGTAVRMHSITFTSGSNGAIVIDGSRGREVAQDDDEEEVDEFGDEQSIGVRLPLAAEVRALQQEIDRAAPGAIVRCRVAPTTVNVIVKAGPGIRLARNETLAPQTGGTGGGVDNNGSSGPEEPQDYLIPIKFCSHHYDTYTLIVPASFTGGNPKVIRGVQLRPHAVDIGFASTFEKVQGRTIARLIMDLNKRLTRPFIKGTSLYVAYTRVREGDHLRVLRGRRKPLDSSIAAAQRHAHDVAETQAKLQYLGNLKVDEKLGEFLAGYDTQGKWKPQLVRQFRQRGAHTTSTGRRTNRPARLQDMDLSTADPSDQDSSRRRRNATAPSSAAVAPVGLSANDNSSRRRQRVETADVEEQQQARRPRLTTAASQPVVPATAPSLGPTKSMAEWQREWMSCAAQTDSYLVMPLLRDALQIPCPRYPDYEFPRPDHWAVAVQALREEFARHGITRQHPRAAVDHQGYMSNQKQNWLLGLLENSVDGAVRLVAYRLGAFKSQTRDWFRNPHSTARPTDCQPAVAMGLM